MALFGAIGVAGSGSTVGCERTISAMAYIFETSEHECIFTARVGGERHKHLHENFEELWTFWTGVAEEIEAERIDPVAGRGLGAGQSAQP